MRLGRRRHCSKCDTRHVRGRGIEVLCQAGREVPSCRVSQLLETTVLSACGWPRPSACRWPAAVVCGWPAAVVCGWPAAVVCGWPAAVVCGWPRSGRLRMARSGRLRMASSGRPRMARRGRLRMARVVCGWLDVPDGRRGKLGWIRVLCALAARPWRRTTDLDDCPFRAFQKRKRTCAHGDGGWVRARARKRCWDSKSTSGGTLCILGSHTFVPISWMCKKQTSVSHSSTESKIISLDAGLRLDGKPALDLWDLIVTVLHGNAYQSNQERGDPCTNLREVRAAPHKLRKRKKSHGMIDDLDTVYFIPSNVNSSRQEALLCVCV